MNRYWVAARKPKPNCGAKLTTAGIQFRDPQLGYLRALPFGLATFLKARSAPSSVLAASAFFAASTKRLYCAGSSGLRSGLRVVKARISSIQEDRHCTTLRCVAAS